MDILKSMKVFRRVVEAGSFSAVARENNQSQSSVSKLVASLEQHLNTKLLNRSTRQLHLTEEGQEYFAYCCRILEDIAEAEASVGQSQSEPTGTLRISATEPFGKIYIVPFLWDFLNQYPKLKMDLILENRYVDLVKEGVDVAIRVGPMKDSSLIARKIGNSPRVTVASPEYLSTRGEPEKPSDLTDHDCITYSLSNATTEWVFKGPEKTEKITVSGRLRASSPDVIGEATVSGLGISTMMLYSAKDYIKQGKLKVILKEFELSSYDINAVYPERKFVPQKVKSLISFLRDRFKAYENS
ncbi:MAG: LysR family transcriptional regulator [endosymbiont of Galathealinum brachiosum]|uniref:LysR family transcriptional regulator n=1 Tax=endosymbiont of Galathealinum brachiosum TaxID=2200906 RepID=A0A370DIX3_9GAMM|nr:MAG: LysR family transcriptional regulator [endosymbiont of Galathealinum brachiosum]